MSGYDLVPVDGGAPVHLPPGESVLGRGPLLGVSDKRVSRHHGLLENLNGQLRLKPTHVNPCFVQSAPGDENPRPLKKDSWHALHHGDFFSLLPGQFVYEVVAVGGEERTPRNSQALQDEERELPVPPEPHVEPANPARADAGQTVTSSAPLSNEEEEDDDNRRGNIAPSVARRRVLPAWMLKTAAASSPTALKKIKAPAAAGEATPTAVSSPEGAGLSQEKRQRKRRRRISDEEEEAGTKTAPAGRLQPVPVRPEVNRSEVSEESDNVTMEEEEEEEGVGVRGQPSSHTRTQTSQTTGRTETAGSDAGAKTRVRMPCPYGKDCYRKNPLHFQECSHPGDSDYQEGEEEEGGEERPECPYGTDCYRKNPLHRKEFKHTRRPARATRAVARRSPADDEDDDEDDDDSFINDDSEDGDNDEDKDYVPLDSDDSGAEDVQRLRREAQEFLRRRK